MQGTQVRSLGQEDPLEKAMAPHSSTLAWKIPWTEEPGRLQSTGSQRIRHDWATSLIRKVKIMCVVCILFLLDSAVLEDSRKCTSFIDGQSNPLGTFLVVQCFPGSSDNKKSACNGGDLSSIPGSGRSSEEGNGYPLQYFCLENSTDRRGVQSMGSPRVRHNWATITFTRGPVVKNPPSNAGDPGLIPGWGIKILHALGQLNPRSLCTATKTQHSKKEKSPTTFV